jgi:AcrR family transcriptional regulator
MTAVSRKPSKKARQRSRDGGTRERLVRAAREVLERGGYGTASVIAIAERADVSAGALYRHFRSKAELFVEVFRAAGEGQLAEMHAAAAGAETYIGRLEAVVATYARRALQNRRLAWALVHEPTDPPVENERLVYRRNYCRNLAALLRGGIAAGEFPKENADLTAAALVGAISETLVGPLSPIGGQTASEDEIVASLLRFCRRSLGVRGVPALRKIGARGAQSKTYSRSAAEGVAGGASKRTQTSWRRETERW